MSMQRENLWSAYLDGELSASEAAEFDQSLTAVEKERLQGEVRFERALGDILSRGGSCPDDVWTRTTAAISKRGGRVTRRTPFWQLGAMAAAAVVALSAGAAVYQSYFATPEFLCEHSMGDVLAELNLPSSDVGEVNDFLHSHGVSLTLNAATQGVRGRRGHHTPALVGATEAEYHGERVTEVMYECCGKPVKVVIATKNGSAANAVRKAIERDGVTDFRSIGDYIAVTVGTHPSRGILDLLSEDDREILQQV